MSGALRRKFETFHPVKRSFPPQNLSVMSLRGGRILAPDAAILKFPVRNPRTRYGNTSRQTPQILIRRRATPQRAQRAQLHASMRLHFTCASKLHAGFARTSLSPCFVPEGHHHGASSEAPFHADVSPHFTCEAYFTCSKSKFHCAATAALRPRNDKTGGFR